AEPPRLPVPQRGEAYLGGPIPMGWIQRAARLPGKAFHLGCALWFQAVCSPSKSAVVKLPRKTRKWFGLERHAFYRALDALERARLVQSERRTGKVPLITILGVPGEA